MEESAGKHPGSRENIRSWGIEDGAAAYVLEMAAAHRIVDAGTRTEAGAMKWLTRKELIDFRVAVQLEGQ